MAPPAARAPRRGRELLPAGLPRRRELLAACAVAALLAHLLLAQLTLVLLALFAVTGRATRWRWWWLLVPAAAGLAWTLAVGPGQAVAGFAAGPSSVLRLLGAARAAGAADGGTPASAAGTAGHPLGALAGIGGWLPRQFPLALPLAAAEAAVLGWLAWLRTDEWTAAPPRPGAVAALRAAVGTRLIEAGGVLTRDGCALGTVAATGATAELRWAETVPGVLVVSAAERPAALACLQLVHAAVRRRKPVIVLDDGRSSALLGALAAACRATGTPLRRSAPADSATPSSATPSSATLSSAAPDRSGRDTAASASQLWGRGGTGQAAASGLPAGGPRPASLREVISERSAALLAADTPVRGAGACTVLRSLAADLRRIGVDGDALVWVPHAELVPAQELAALLRDAAAAGLAVLAATTSAVTAIELAPLVGTLLIRRVTDQDLAAALAPRAGTRLLPPSAAAPGLPERRAAASASPTAVSPTAVSPSAVSPSAVSPSAVSPSAVSSTYGSPASALTAVPEAALVPAPVVSAQALLTLGEAEFVLAVSTPRRRLIAPGRLVPARLPEVPG